jgi:hypothetical protein
MGQEQEAPGVDRRGLGRIGADERARPANERPTRRASTVEDAILDLQHAAGNRGVAAALGQGGKTVVQRQPKSGRKNDGGALSLGGEEIPLQSATWSLKTTIATAQMGQSRRPSIHEAGLHAGDLTLKRRPDDHSGSLPDLMSTEYEKGTLRLDRPSRDGAIPATNLELVGASLVSYAVSKGDNPTETLVLGVDWMKVSGMGKDEDVTAKASARKASRWVLRATPVGGDALPAVPLMSVEYSAPRSEGFESATMAIGKMRPTDAPVRAKVTMHAGMALTRLAKAQTQGERLDLAFAIGGDDRLRLDEAIVEEIRSSSDGPDIVEVGFVAEEQKRIAGSAPRAGGAANR